MARTMCGRRMILTDVRTIDESNVVQVLQKAFVTHLANKIDIDYLWKYYKGRQPILDRTKDVRPEIMNKVVVNRANEIVSFKVGYLMGEPVQYVSRGDDEIVAQNISKLNSYMLEEDKPTKDKELAEWQHIAGTAYRIVLPDKEAGVDPDAAPFEIYTLDPRFSFVVRYNDLGLPTVMGVKYVERGNGDRVFGCYTADHYYEIDSSWKILKNEEQIFGIPIIEYPLNNARLGAFEIVLPLLDAINTVDSNRLDGVEQFIQALLLFHNVDISSPDYAVTDKAYAALIELCADICRRNGIKQLLWKGDKSLVGKVDQQNMTVHRWFAAKACPGDYLYERHGDIAAKVNAKLNSNQSGVEVPVTVYRTLPDVPSSYRPTIQKLMEKKALCGYLDPDPTRLDDNIICVDEVYCRVMTTLDRLGVLG